MSIEESSPVIKSKPSPLLVGDRIHDQELFDPYRWLEDQTSRETRLWLAEQRRSAASLSTVLGRDRMRTLVEKCLRSEIVHSAVRAGGSYVFCRRKASEDQAALIVRNVCDGQERTLVDPNRMDPSGTISVVLIAVSSDGERLAYGLRDRGRDDYSKHFIDVKTGITLGATVPSQIPITVSPEVDAYYYSERSGLRYSVMRRQLRSDRADEEVFLDTRPGIQSIGVVCLDCSRSFLFIVRHSRSDVTEYVVRLADGTEGVLVRTRSDLKTCYSGEVLYVLTTDSAPRGRVLALDLKAWNAAGLSRVDEFGSPWTELIPETDQVIERIAMLGEYLAVGYVDSHTSSTGLDMYTKRGGFVRRLKSFVPGTVDVPPWAARSTVVKASGEEALYSMSAFDSPPAIMTVDTRSLEQKKWHQRAAPFDLGDIRTEALECRASDGSPLHLVLAHRRDVHPSAELPCLLTAYGGFGLSFTPRFTWRTAIWLRLGGLYASAIPRGGGEKGEEWHLAGTRENRPRVIADFISAAEFLIATRYTAASKLAAIGGSNSGLLVTAAMIQRPELFRAVVCFGPLTDMLRFHLQPGAGAYVKEFGDPENPYDFAYLSKYSPYHGVKQGVSYPAVLMISGDSDTRCDPMHARKMTARLQSCTSSGHPVLLLYDPDRGHAGQLPLERRIEALTDQFSFLVSELGGPEMRSD